MCPRVDVRASVRLKPDKKRTSSTTSLPFSSEAGKRGQARVTAATKVPQAEGFVGEGMTLAWARVPALVFPRAWASGRLDSASFE